MLSQALETAICGLVLKTICVEMIKRINLFNKKRPAQIENFLNSLLMLPGQKSLLLPSGSIAELIYPEVSNSHFTNSSNLYLPEAQISYPNESKKLSENPYSYSAHNLFGFDFNKVEDVTSLQGSKQWHENLVHSGLPTQNNLLLAASPVVWQMLIKEKEKQIQMLSDFVSLAIKHPVIYAKAYQSQNEITMNLGSDISEYDLRGVIFSGGFAETVHGYQVSHPQYGYIPSNHQI